MHVDETITVRQLPVADTILEERFWKDGVELVSRVNFSLLERVCLSRQRDCCDSVHRLARLSEAS